MNRFKWVDDRTILIANEEGIEKLIDVEANFNELQYNYRPLFNQISGQEWKTVPYYRKRVDMYPIDQLGRLKRSY